MTEKRFMIDFENECIIDTIDNEVYNTLIGMKTLLNTLNDEKELLKKEILWWKYRCGEDISKDIEADKIVRKLLGVDIPYGSYTDKEYEKGLKELLKPKTLNCTEHWDGEK